MIELKKDKSFVFLSALAAIFIILTAVQIINFDVWGDEGYSILLAKMSVKELISSTALDVHPPLYYLILKFFCEIFGFQDVVYQSVSMLPYIMLLLWAITILRKEFGGYTAAIFIILQSLTYVALKYNVELRMYSWAEFFVIGCVFSVYRILQRQEKKDWIMFVFCGLCAAYTHYYSLISVAIVYVVLYAILIYKNRKNVLCCLTSGAITSFIYFPWLMVLFSTLKRVENNYWISEIPTVWQCFYELVSGKSGMVLLVAFFGASIVFLIKFLNDKNLKNAALMVLICLLTLLGTMAVGIVVSRLIRPVFLVRYLYPCAGLMWLATAICLPKVIKSNRIIIAFSAFFLLNGMRVYVKNFSDQYHQKSETDITLNYLIENTGADGAVIAPGSGHLMWTVLEYYLPNTKRIAIEDSETWVGINDPVYFLEENVSTAGEKTWKDIVLEEGKEYEHIMEGRISVYPFNIYKIISVNDVDQDY